MMESVHFEKASWRLICAALFCYESHDPYNESDPVYGIKHVSIPEIILATVASEKYSLSEVDTSIVALILRADEATVKRMASTMFRETPLVSSDEALTDFQIGDVRLFDVGDLRTYVFFRSTVDDMIIRYPGKQDGHFEYTTISLQYNYEKTVSGFIQDLYTTNYNGLEIGINGDLGGSHG